MMILCSFGDSRDKGVSMLYWNRIVIGVSIDVMMNNGSVYGFISVSGRYLGFLIVLYWVWVWWSVCIFLYMKDGISMGMLMSRF